MRRRRCHLLPLECVELASSVGNPFEAEAIDEVESLASPFVVLMLCWYVLKTSFVIADPSPIRPSSRRTRAHTPVDIPPIVPIPARG